MEVLVLIAYGFGLGIFFAVLVFNLKPSGKKAKSLGKIRVWNGDWSEKQIKSVNLTIYRKGVIGAEIFTEDGEKLEINTWEPPTPT